MILDATPSASMDPEVSSIDDGPIVGRTAGTLNPLVILAAFLFVAIMLFLFLNGRREARLAEAQAPVVLSSAQAYEPPLLQPPIPPALDAATGPFTSLPIQVGPPPPPPIPQVVGPVGPAFVRTALAPSEPDAGARLRAPSLVVDLGSAEGRERVTAAAVPATGAQTAATTAAAAAAAGATGQGQRSQLTDSEQFAERVGGEEPDRARAVAMTNLRFMTPQGTVIPGVLETAINSDLPGFARAIVSRDVYGFDGKAVLIPRGSRLIGQYKSAVALGQSRAFVIWTRLIRPDGVSIQIGSPVTDDLGRGGLDGKVDRHFFSRFAGSILLSVLNAGVAAVGQTPTTAISIGSPGAAGGLAASALQGENIPPTIKVRQGESINIFLARDLDFSGVGPAK